MACSVNITIPAQLRAQKYIDSKMNIIGNSGEVFLYIQSVNKFAKDNFNATGDVVTTKVIKNNAGVFTKVFIDSKIAQEIDTFREEDTFNSKFTELFAKQSVENKKTDAIFERPEIKAILEEKVGPGRSMVSQRSEIRKSLTEIYRLHEGNPFTLEDIENFIFDNTLDPEHALIKDLFFTEPLALEELSKSFYALRVLEKEMNEVDTFQEEIPTISNTLEDEAFTTPSDLPLGDNYGEFLRYKRDQLDAVNKELEHLKISKRTSKNLVELDKKSKEYYKRKNTLEEHIQLLEENIAEYMFKVIHENLEHMKQALESSEDLVSIDEIKKTLNFYKEFIAGKNEEYTAGSFLEYGSEIYGDLVSKIDNLLENYTSLVRDKIVQMLSDSSLVQETIANSGTTLEEMLAPTKDLNWVDKNFLGIMSSNSNDTILPQFLQILMHQTQLKHNYTVDALVENLHEIEKSTGMYNPEWLVERDANGLDTGNIIDLYTQTWYDSSKEVGKKIADYFAGKNKKKNHNAIMEWFNKNTNIIDISKIPEVRAKYQGIPFYDKYFQDSTDQDAALQEARLRAKYGPKYNDVVNRLLQNLEMLEETRLNSGEQSYVFQQKNLWEFITNVKTTDKKLKQNIEYEIDGLKKTAFYNDFKSIPYFPKDTVTDYSFNEKLELQLAERPSNFLNQKFIDTVMADSKNMDYYLAIKDLSEYINNTYESNTSGRLSHPKVMNSWLENSADTFKDLKSGKLKSVKKLGVQSLEAWKGLFYEQGSYAVKGSDVHSNYVDRSKSLIRDKANLYMQQGLDKDTAFKKASDEILPLFSTDISKNLKAVAEMAALHNARIEVAPIADAIFDVYKDIRAHNEKTGQMEERKNGIARLEYYIDHIIYNNVQKYRNSNKIEGTSWNPKLKGFLDIANNLTKGYINEKSLHHLSDSEKQLFEGYKELLENGKQADSLKVKDLGFDISKSMLVDSKGNKISLYNINGEKATKEEFDAKYNEYLTKKIESIGLDLNLAGAIDGIMRTIIYKSLALNPISGVFNRVEGLNSAYNMDATGNYWTPGNIDSAKEMMAYYGVRKLSFDKLDIRSKNKVYQMNIFEALIKKMPGVLQDRKNELQRNASDAKFDITQVDIFSAAVGIPEGKNQGSIMLAMMMDFNLKDKDGKDILKENGEPLKLLDRESKLFNGFEVDQNGLLKAKPGFEHLLDIANFENLIIGMSAAIARSQGNYSTNDIMLGKKHVWGRAATMFKTWLPEHLNQRFGVSDKGQVDLYRRNKKADGRFIAGLKANKLNAFTILGASLGISYGLLGVVGLAGGGLISAFVAKKYLSKLHNEKSVNREINHIQEFTQMLFSLGIEFMNYTPHLLSSLPGMSKLKAVLPKNNTFKNTTMTEEQINSMKSMTRELSIMLTWLGFKFAVMALYKGIGGDDDDDKSPRRMKYYFIQNQLSRSITSLNSYMNPYAFINDNSRSSFMAELTAISKLLYSMATFDWDGVQKNILAPTPVPAMLDKSVRAMMGTQEAPYENKMDYSMMVDFNKIPSPLRWVAISSKDYLSGGEYSKKSDYLKARATIRDEIKQDFVSKYGNDEELIKTLTDAKMLELVGSKYKELDFTEATELIESGERIIDPKKKAPKGDRETVKNKLKEQGLSGDEIAAIMRIEFKGR